MKAIDFINPNAKYRSELYTRWEGIRGRCNQPSHPVYKDYGGRGIKVYPLWDDSKYGFASFYCWSMYKHFLPELSIERIDVNGNYDPSNCCWIPFADQIHNRRCSIRIWDNDKYISMKTYCDIHKDTNSYQSCLSRVHNGIPPYIALYYTFVSPATKWWTFDNRNNLFPILYSILKEHPNLIEDNTISLDDYVYKYLAKHVSFN